MKALIPTDLSQYERIETGDTKESTFVFVFRLLLDGNPPKYVHPAITNPLVEILGSGQKLAFYERITGVKQLMIRRSQVHIMPPGGYVGYHRDSESSAHYIAAVVLLFEAASVGGEFIVYDQQKERLRVHDFSMLVTQADLAHEVSRVENGQRLSLVFWLARRT